MKVGFYQFNPILGDIKGNLDRVSEKIRSIHCDLLVLPELAMTGYQFTSMEEVQALSEIVPEGETTQTIIRLAKERSMHIVVGLAERKGEQCFNAAVLVGPEGFIGVYRKTHLFFEETLFFTPGDTGFRVWDIGKAKLGLMVCFDWYYPEAARTLALNGADILCHPSNLVLPNCPEGMLTRCLENRVFCITANRVGEEARGGKPALTYIGQSEVVNPQGKVLCRASETQEELLLVDIDVSEARNKSLNQYNDLIRDRKSHHYAL
jgi:predicted amidohydrolase